MYKNETIHYPADEQTDCVFPPPGQDFILQIKNCTAISIISKHIDAHMLQATRAPFISSPFSSFHSKKRPLFTEQNKDHPFHIKKDGPCSIILNRSYQRQRRKSSPLFVCGLLRWGERRHGNQNKTFSYSS